MTAIMRLVLLRLQVEDPQNVLVARPLRTVLLGMRKGRLIVQVLDTVLILVVAGQGVIIAILIIGCIAIRGQCDMDKSILIVLLLHSLFGLGQEKITVEVKPVDFVNPPKFSDHFPRGVKTIIMSDGLIYFSCEMDPFVTVMNDKGVILDVIGGRGGGPGELGQGVLAMAMWEKDLYVVSVSKTLQMTWFEDGVYKDQIHMPSQNIHYVSMNSNMFGVGNNVVVFPAHPATGRLANAFKGEIVEPVGELLFDRRDVDLIKRIPAANDTMWQYDGEYWYCVFKHHPMVQKYNSNFEMVETFNIEDSFTLDRHSKMLDFDSSMFSYAPPLFYDFKIKNGNMYFSLVGGIIMVSPKGKTLKLFTFFAKGEPFASNGIDGKSGLNFPYFVVLDDGNFLLSSFGDSWGHPFWRAEIVKSSGVRF